MVVCQFTLLTYISAWRPFYRVYTNGAFQIRRTESKQEPHCLLAQNYITPTKRSNAEHLVEY